MIDTSKIAVADISAGVRGRRVVDQPQGSGAITIGELEVAVGAGLALHRHKVEEVIIVRAGQARFTLDGISTEADPGAILHAPAGHPHSLESIGTAPLQIYFAFPAVNVEREWL